MPIAERLERRADVRAGSFDPETLSFQVAIGMGLPVERHDPDGAFIETLAPDQSWPSSTPLLAEHDATSANDVLGRISSIRTEGAELVLTAKLASRPDAIAIGRDIEDGTITSLRINYDVRLWRSWAVKGRRQKVAAQWRIRSVSLPIPADDDAETLRAA